MGFILTSRQHGASRGRNRKANGEHLVWLLFITFQANDNQVHLIWYGVQGYIKQSCLFRRIGLNRSYNFILRSLDILNRQSFGWADFQCRDKNLCFEDFFFGTMVQWSYLFGTTWEWVLITLFFFSFLGKISLSAYYLKNNTWQHALCSDKHFTFDSQKGHISKMKV